jgi:predicted ATPase/DNA-binding SARP family transcriptional activator
VLVSDTHPNIPLPLTRFIGRARELAEVKRLLRLTRLLTLTGSGGCGKTRLAIQLAAELADEFPDGVWFVELASLADPALVAQTVAARWGIREAADHPLMQTLAESLRRKKLLLILDNCEHLVTACAQVTATLLPHCPALRIVATSREALNVAGETVWLVPSLSFPDPHTLPSLEDLAQYEAIALFLDRAQAAAPTFHLSPQNVRAIAAVCQRLDGIPLALELAAARVKMLSVEQMLQRLQEGFRLLTTSSSTALPRHQTLQATMEWSYHLLTEQEQLLFRRLSVFAGGFSLEAVEAVCVGSGLERDAVLEVFSRLVDKSLVVVVEQGAELRYRLLETMRQYGQEQLRLSAELAPLQEAHAAFFLGFAQAIEPHLTTAERPVWLRRLEGEHDNLRAALAWSQTALGQQERGLRLAGTLWWFWFHRGWWSEGRRWLESLLALTAAAGSARAKLLLGAGWLAFAQGDHEHARAQLEESVRLWRQVQDTRGLAYALTFLSQVVQVQGNQDLARVLAEESVALFRGSSDPFGLGIALIDLGNVRRAEDDTLAQPWYEEAIALLRTSGDAWALAMPVRHLGDAAFRQGDHARAIAFYQESLALCKQAKEKWFTSRGLENLAGVVGMQGDAERAARLFGAAEALREVIGAPVMAYYRPQYERALAVVRQALDEASFAQAWAAGRTMTLEQAFAYALEEPAPSPTTVGHPARVEAGTSHVPLRLFALGSAQVYRGEQALSPTEGLSAKARSLLFYLLCQPAAMKGQIGLALWPDASAPQLRSSFHVTVHHLRQALGQPEWILFEQQRYAFNRHLSYWCDVETFEAHLAQARQIQATKPAEALAQLEQAITLYQGDFLQDVQDGDWYLARRDALRTLYVEALLTKGHLCFTQRRYTDAAEAYRQAITQERYLEVAHRALMQSLARLGERSQALRHYQTLLELLQDELGAPPAPETTALFEALRRGEMI